MPQPPVRSDTRASTNPLSVLHFLQAAPLLTGNSACPRFTIILPSA